MRRWSSPLPCGRFRRLLTAAVAAVGSEQSLALPAEVHSCIGLARLEGSSDSPPCVEGLIHAADPEAQAALQKTLRLLGELRHSCGAALDRSTLLGCKAFARLGYDVLAEAVALVQECPSRKEACSGESLVRCARAQRAAWQATADQHWNTVAEAFVSRRLLQIHGEVFRDDGSDEHSASSEEDGSSSTVAWQTALAVAERLKYWVSGYIWRETHWLWLQDCIAAERVVQTTWGTAEDWLRFGVHDAHADAPLSQVTPLYTFSELLGMRWQILASLLKELQQRRGTDEQLQLVEIGVFAGQLSQYVLRNCDFVRLLGVDPYIGSDGTFPGNFSRTLDSEVALYKAASVMEPFGERAQLWPLTSKAAAAEVPDGTVDAIFIDGCHLYDCVKEDFDLWLPKLRRGHEVLVAGHDFSPQWPGVVRAVHEQRAGGQRVNLASDWMFWWFDNLSSER